MTLKRKFNTQRYWRGLIVKAQQVVKTELNSTIKEIPLEQIKGDVCGWIEDAIPRLEMWEKHQHFPSDSRAKKDFNKKIKNLRLKLEKMQGVQSVSPSLVELLSNMVSVSLLRLQPFRRTMIWDRYHNSLLPRSFIEDRVEGIEASLATGETAFAAFASSVAAHKSGMVIGDDMADLRGTYFLIDRITGLHTNVFVPMRETPGGSQALLGVVTISLPIRNAFNQNFAQKLSWKLKEYQDGIELMWGYEQLDELIGMETEEYPESPGLALSLLKDLVPDAESGRGTARFPGCAILKGNALSRMSDGAVDIQEALFVASPSHLSHFAQTELELSAYGVRDRVMTLENDFKEIWTNGIYSLWASAQISPDAGDTPWSVIAEIGEIVNATFEADSPNPTATQLHRILESQRSLFIYFLDYVTTGDKAKQRNLIMSLHCICTTPELQRKVNSVERKLASLREWGERAKAEASYLCVCIKTPVLTLNYPANEIDYLSGFKVISMDKKAEWALSSLCDKDYVKNSYPEKVAHEIRVPRRFTAWCRAISSLVSTSLEPEMSKRFIFKDFGLYDQLPPPGARTSLLAYLPSLLLPDGAQLHVHRDGEAVEICISTGASGMELKSDWTMRNLWLPLASSAYPQSVQLVPMKLRLQELPDEETLFFDFKRPQVSFTKKPWTVNADEAFGDSPLQLIRQVVRAVPQWMASMECIAAVPLSTDNTMKIPKWSQWSMGNGQRHMLLAGILMRKPVEWVSAREDVEIRSASSPSKLQKDPFLRRFQKLLEGAQRRQRALQRLKTETQSNLLMTHIFHDVCNPQKLRAFEQILKDYKSYHRHNPQAAKNVLEAGSAVADLNQSYYLHIEINSDHEKQPTLTEIDANIPAACKMAVRHAAQKIQRELNIPVHESELFELLPEYIPDTVSTHSPQVLLILLDNIIRNALVGAWQFNRRTKRDEKRTITIHTQNRDRCVVFGNEAPVATWRRVVSLYNNTNLMLGDDNMGISIVQLAAKHLHLKTDINWRRNSVYGEIHLHTDKE
jgi:hypothetical protein